MLAQFRHHQLVRDRQLAVDDHLFDAAGHAVDHVGLASETGKRVGELSLGQQRRLDLALVLSKRPNLLLLDEPTNHLSFTLVDELTIALGATQAAVVLSSHDRQLLRDVASWPQLQLTARAEGDVLA